MMSAQVEQTTEQALEEHHLSCFAWALACCRWDRDEAQEVLQTAYLRILEGRARLNGSEISRPWIFGVVRTVALEQRRRRLIRALALEKMWRGRLAPDSRPAAFQHSADQEAQRRLRGMLARLSSRQRELLHLVFYQDMTIEQAAEVLGISVGSARVHYERGKARLREMLPQEEHP